MYTQRAPVPTNSNWSSSITFRKTDWILFFSLIDTNWRLTVLSVLRRRLSTDFFLLVFFLFEFVCFLSYFVTCSAISRDQIVSALTVWREMILPVSSDGESAAGVTTLAILTVCDQMMNCLAGLWRRRLKGVGLGPCERAHTQYTQQWIYTRKIE